MDFRDESRSWQIVGIIHPRSHRKFFSSNTNVTLALTILILLVGTEVVMGRMVQDTVDHHHVTMEGVVVAGIYRVVVQIFAVVEEIAQSLVTGIWMLHRTWMIFRNMTFLVSFLLL